MLRSTWKRGRTVASCAMRASSFSAVRTAEIERCSLFRMVIAFMEGPISDDAGISGALADGAQVAVEKHADRAHEQPAARRDHDPLIVDLDQAVVRQLFQHLQLRGEITAEIHEVGELD